MKYSIDTSGLLDAWRRYYPPDIFPAVWRALESLIDDGELVASDEVFHELERRDDEVFAWAKDHRSMFVPLDDEVQSRVSSILALHEGSRELLPQHLDDGAADQ